MNFSIVLAEIFDCFINFKVAAIFVGLVRVEIPDARILSKSSSSEDKRMLYL